MRSHFTKALAIVVLATFLGIPWGLYNEQYAEDASTMSQEQWLDYMEITQQASANGIGLTGTIVLAIIMITGFVCIYEFIKLVSDMIVGRFFGPEDDGVTLLGL